MTEPDDAPEAAAEEFDDDDLLEDQGFALLRPITLGEETIARLEFKDPHAGQLRVTDRHKGEAAQMLALIAKMTGVPIKAIDALHPYDLRRAKRIVERFFGESPSGGGFEV